MQDYYKVLEVKPDASPEDIKKNFRKLALKYHPDRSGGDSCENKFKKINQAYSILSDPQKRQEYDIRRTNPGGFSGFEGFRSPGGFGDVWSEFFGDFGDIFGNKNQRPRRQPEPRVRFEVSFSDLESGQIVQEFSRKFDEVCDTCSGLGGSNPKICSTCNGTGQVAVVHQVGTMRIQNVTDCPHCNGRGKTFSKPCRKCGTQGTITKSKKYRVKIDTEIIH